MPFGQKLKAGVMSGMNFTKNLLQKSYHHGKQALSALDHGFNTGVGVYQAMKPALQNLAPERMQQGLSLLDTHVGKAQDRYNTLRNKIDQREHKIAQNVGMVMGNLKKKNIDIG